MRTPRLAKRCADRRHLIRIVQYRAQGEALLQFQQGLLDGAFEVERAVRARLKDPMPHLANPLGLFVPSTSDDGGRCRASHSHRPHDPHRHRGIGHHRATGSTSVPPGHIDEGSLRRRRTCFRSCANIGADAASAASRRATLASATVLAAHASRTSACRCQRADRDRLPAGRARACRGLQAVRTSPLNPA